MNVIKNKESKFSFIGISLAGIGTTESAIAIIDRNNRIIRLDKVFSMNDVKYFADTLPGKQNSVIAVSVPDNEVMISHKWKYNSRTYDLVNFDKKMINKDGWTERFSARGSEYLKELKSEGLDVFRYYTDNMKSFYATPGIFKNRTPVDCKALQDALRYKYDMSELPSNMLPVAQLEALLGAMCVKELTLNTTDCPFKISGEFEGLPVIGT